MHKVIQILEQIDASKKFILNDTLYDYRIALLLIDNCVEIIMQRIVKHKFEQHDFMEKLKNRHKINLDEITTRTIFNHDTLTKAKKYQITKYFGEKLKYLSSDLNLLDNSILKVVSYLHHYRNDAYHNDFVRQGSIKPAVLLYFRILNEFFLPIIPNTIGYSSEDDFSIYEKKYNFTVHHFVADNSFDIIKKEFIDSIPTNDLDIKNNLINHLSFKIEELDNAIYYLNNDYKIGNTCHETFKLLQYFEYSEINNIPHDPFLIENYKATYDYNIIENWKERINFFHDIDDVFILFNEFSFIEKEIEPIEKIVNNQFANIESYIQLQIDIMRGK